MNAFLQLLLFATGLFFIWKGRSVLALNKKMPTWRKVGIDILEADVASELDVIQYARLTYYYPVVRYRYAVGGREIESRRVALDRKSIWVDSPSHAAVLVEQICKEKTAYCDPDDPRRSVIYPSLSPKRVSHYRTFVLAGTILVVVSVWLFVKLFI